MPYTVTKVADGDNVLGRYRTEHVVLKPAAADYPAGGYALSGIPPSSGNVGMTKIYFAIPVGGQGGYVWQWNPATAKMQVFQQSAATSALTEVPAATDLSALNSNLLLFGQ